MPQRQLDNCRNCNIKLNENNRAYRLNSCRNCYNKYKRRVNTDNYQQHVAETKDYHRKYSLKRRYNMTKEEYDKKLEIQLGGCAICKQSLDKIGVDHDHETGVVRDLLCYRCNNVLGHVNDDEDLLIDMIEYLKRHARKTA